MQTAIQQIMEKSHLFEGLQPNLIEKLASCASYKTIAAGEILFQKGDPANALWGVLSGRIVIEVTTEDGKELVIDAFGKGEVFGEVGVIDFGPRRTEARATQDSELFRLERKHFLKYLQRSPELCFRVFTLLCSHLRQTTENLEDTALHALTDRLAKRLVMLTAEGQPGDRSILHMSQSDLAGMLGVNREAVNRHLREFENNGLIVLRRQIIEIVDQQALTDLAFPGKRDQQEGWGTGNQSVLKHSVFEPSPYLEKTRRTQGRHSVGLLAIDAAEYSHSLMTDAAGTIKRIEAGLRAIDRAIEQYRGHTVWHTGDRILAEFTDAQLAMQAALAIQEQVSPAGPEGKRNENSLFRIGVHYGEVEADENHFLGEAVNTVIGLTGLSKTGGVAISAAVRDALDDQSQLDLKFLGNQEFNNVPGTVPVYSVSAISLWNVLLLRTRARMPRRLRLAAIGATAIVLLAGIWITGNRVGRQNAPVASSQQSIAVLPFTGSDDPTLGYLAEGLPAEVRAALFTIPGIRVIGRESAGYFRERDSSVEDMGRILEVTWLLRGNLQSADNQPLVSIELLNTASGEMVWQEQFRDLSEGVGGLARKIVRRIGVSMGMTGEDGMGIPQLLPLTSEPEAHRLYLEAQSLIWHGRGRYMVDAVPLLQSAVERDPSFAEAHAVLATMYKGVGMLDEQQAYDPEVRQELARQSLQKALSLKPDSPLVLAKAAEIRMLDNDPDGAQALVERALRIDPNNTDALGVRSWLEYEKMDWASALETSEQWLRLEPLSVIAITSRLQALLLADRYEDVMSLANRALAFYPDTDVPFIYATMAIALLNLGDRLGAIDASRKGMPYGAPVDLWTGLEYDWAFFDEFDPVRSAVGLVYVEDYDRVRQLLVDTWGGDDRDSRQSHHLEYLVNRAELEALAGDYTLAVEFFEQARSLTKDHEGGLVKTNIGYNVLDWSRQSYFPVAMLFAYRKAGQHEIADIIAEQFESFLARQINAKAAVSDQPDYPFLYKQAQYYAIEGLTQEALDRLRTWVDNGAEIFTYIKWDPFMESLRGNPEFEAMVAKVEAELAAIRARHHAQQAAKIGAEN